MRQCTTSHFSVLGRRRLSAAAIIFHVIVQLQLYNPAIFGNMNAVFLTALQDFFSNGGTADLIVVDTFKMGCHEGCPR
ncbi:hypothetical protein, partial [Prevotella sp.]|uniref:hypothetical protein n=1 Tax=Prevotella sp. TaxID=59823 RepID=UPI004025A5C0